MARRSKAAAPNTPVPDGPGSQPLTSPPPSPGNSGDMEVPVRSVDLRQSIADPNVRKPAGVAASAAQAEEMWRAVYQQEEDALETDQGDSQENEGEGEEEQSQDGEPAQGEADADQFAQSREPHPDEWEHRYNSMRGRYDQAAEQNRQLMQRLNQLEQYIKTTTSPPAYQEPPPQSPRAPAGPAAAPPQASQRLVTPNDLDEYGEDFLGVIGRQARDAVSPELAQLRQEVKRLNQQLGSVGTHIQMDARGRMEADLDQTLPAWREINTDQDFLDWLQLQDSYSGVIRHQLLLRAFEQNQTPRVLAFFQGFLAEAAASRPAGNGQAPAAAQYGPPQPQMDLSQFAAPGRGRPAAASQAPTTKPLISRTDISRFYSDVRAGHYQVTPERRAEKLQIEQMIIDAQREGRIV